MYSWVTVACQLGAVRSPEGISPGHPYLPRVPRVGPYVRPSWFAGPPGVSSVSHLWSGLAMAEAGWTVLLRVSYQNPPLCLRIGSVGSLGHLNSLSCICAIPPLQRGDSYGLLLHIGAFEKSSVGSDVLNLSPFVHECQGGLIIRRGCIIGVEYLISYRLIGFRPQIACGF